MEAEREEKMALERQIEELREQITAADDALVAAMMQNEQNQQSSPSASTPTGKQEPSRLEKPSAHANKVPSGQASRVIQFVDGMKDAAELFSALILVILMRLVLKSGQR